MSIRRLLGQTYESLWAPAAILGVIYGTVKAIAWLMGIPWPA